MTDKLKKRLSFDLKNNLLRKQKSNVKNGIDRSTEDHSHLPV